MRALRLFAFVAMGWLCTALSAAAQTTAAPTFSIPAGTYNSVETLVLTDATPGAVIYYTVNATTPTTASTQYTVPITLKETRTIEAMAIAPGQPQSTTVSQSYAFAALAPTISPNGGAFTTPQTVALATTPGVKIFYTTNGAAPTSSSTPYTVPFTVSKAETVKAISEQTYFTSSPVVTAAFTFGTTAPPTLSPGPGTYAIGQKVTISDATAGSTIYYTVDGTTPNSTSTRYTVPITIATPRTVSAIAIANAASSSVVTAHYALVTATPVLSPVSFTSPTVRHVTITDPTSGAAIYYTTDGSNPTADSTLYSGLIAISQTTALKAIAVAAGYAQSNIANGAYVFPFIQTIAGNGTAGYSGDGGPATSAEFGSADSIAIDKAGDLIIADSANGCFRKVSAITGIITDYLFPCVHDRYDTGSLAGGEHFAFDSAGNLYYSDAGVNVIHKVDNVTKAVSIYAGVPYTIPGYTPYPLGNYSGDGGPATSAQLDVPTGIRFDSYDNLYIADSGNNVIREVSASTGVINTVVGDGTGAMMGFCPGYIYGGDGVPATQAKLNFPNDLAFDSHGNLYIADYCNGAVRKFDVTSGILTTYAGDPTWNTSDPVPPNQGDGGPATSALAGGINGIALDGQDNLFISELTDQRIRMVNATTHIMTTVAGSGSKGGDPVEGAPATQTLLLDPTGVAVDQAGNLYILQLWYDSRILRVPLSAAPAPDFGVPY